MKLIKQIIILLILIISFENYAYSGLIKPKPKPDELITNLSPKVSKDITNFTKDKKNFIEKKIVKKKVEEKFKKTLFKNKAIKQKISNFYFTKEIGIYPPEKPIDLGLKKNLSKILSKRDYRITQKIFNYIKRNNWKLAFKESKKTNDKIVKNLIRWIYLIETKNNANFYDYVKFITKNKEWPRINRLRYLAEHKIDYKIIAPIDVISFFKDKEPLSGFGAMKLGEAFLIAGKKNESKKLIKKGFVTAFLSRNDLRYVSKKFKNILSSEDYIKRADHMAWENKYWELKRTIKYLPKGYKELYFARFALMTRSYGVDSAIKKVPKNLIKNIGLEFNRMKWRRKRGRYDSALDIIKLYTNKAESLVRPELWFKQKLIIARKKIDQKKYNQAYILLTNHGIKEKSKLAKAEWHAGWLALSFLNKPNKSIIHFKTMYDSVNYPISRARGAYWLGKAYEKTNNKTKSLKWFEIASIHNTTFYGQLASAKIGKKKLIIRNDYQLNKKKYANFLKSDFAKIIILLDELEETRRAKSFIKHLGNEESKLENRIFAGTLSQKVDRFDYSIQIAKQASYQGINLLDLNYPIIETPREVKNQKTLDQEYILALIRQESEFDRSANSHVGAKGLMQIMPATGKLLSKKIGIRYSKQKLIKNEYYNLKLGSYYITNLYKNFDNNIYLALAAYNAGPHRVSRWIKKFGDPRKKEIDTIDFLEHIPFLETRNYVQRVIENINVYKYVIKKKSVDNNIQKILYN